MNIEFHVYNASGQNFIVIDNRELRIDDRDYRELARILCKYSVKELQENIRVYTK